MEKNTKKLLNYIAKWQKILLLEDWVIGIKIQKYKGEMGNMEHTDGWLFVNIELEYKRAVIFIDPKNIKDIDEESILHEIIHVRLAELTKLFDYYTTGNKKVDEYIFQLKHQADERVTTDFMHIIGKMGKIKLNYKML